MSVNFPSGRALPSNGAKGTVLTKASTTDEDAAWTNVISTGAGVPGATFTTLLYQDTTASTGGLYAWTGSAYVKVALATT
jgi:hypothetical protein